jgi:hypothetical protein
MVVFMFFYPFTYHTDMELRNDRKDRKRFRTYRQFAKLSAYWSFPLSLQDLPLKRTRDSNQQGPTQP